MVFPVLSLGNKIELRHANPESKIKLQNLANKINLKSQVQILQRNEIKLKFSNMK